MYSDWHSLGEVSYRKWKLYDINWQAKGILLDQYQIFGAYLGGPLALLKENKRPSHTAHSNFNCEKIDILIFSAAGISISDIEYESSSRIVSMGWSDLEQLVIVHENGMLVFNFSFSYSSLIIYEPYIYTSLKECAPISHITLYL